MTCDPGTELGPFNHIWIETGVVATHAIGGRMATYVRCQTCGQNGFKFPPRRVIYTWRDE